MANDKSLELRVALQEYQMGTLEERLAQLASKDDLSRFATKDDLLRFATKEDLARFATKEDLARFATKEDLARFATREDLERSQQSTRNWMLTVILSVTALQFAMQYAMFQLYVH